jgi:hypothetical protein
VIDETRREGTLVETQPSETTPSSCSRIQEAEASATSHLRQCAVRGLYRTDLSHLTEQDQCLEVDRLASSMFLFPYSVTLTLWSAVYLEDCLRSLGPPTRISSSKASSRATKRRDGFTRLVVG